MALSNVKLLDRELLERVIAVQQEIASVALNTHAVMKIILDRTQELTRGTGGMVELLEGDEMVYHAVSDNIVQYLGLRLRVDASLSGRCVRSQEVLKCEDVETDPRVDLAACRKIGVRSMVLVPLKHGNECAGVLKIFWDRPNAFSDAEVRVLQLMVGLLGPALKQASTYAELSKMHRNMVRDSGARVQAMISNAPIVIWSINREGIFTYSDGAGLASRGLRPGERIGQSIFEAYKHHPGIKNAVHAALAGREQKFEAQLDDHSWYDLSCTPLYDDDGAVSGVVGVAVDITDRVVASREIQALKILIDASPHAILVTDLDQKVVRWNRACEKIFGWSESEVIGQHLPFVPQEERDESQSRIDNIIGNREPEEFEVDRLRKDGTKIRIAVSAVPLLDSAGVAYGHMSISNDVTVRHRAMEELRAARLAAEAAARAKSEFLANMSHEIRTPIHGVMGMASLLLDTKLNIEQRGYVETVRSSADSLLSVVNDILDLSKAEAGKMDLESIPFEPTALVSDVLRTLAYALHQKGLRLHTEIDAGVPPKLLGDPMRLKQVLLNLLNNAIKFTSQGSVSIDLRVKSAGAQKVELCFSVRDTGIGIPAESQATIFQAFTQADTSTTRRFGGTGLGLSICRRLVSLMGGEIGVESNAGRGSNFWFVVPFDLHVGDAAQLPAPGAEFSSGVGRLRILVAEDNGVNQLIALKMLEKLGHDARAVDNGVLAVAALEENEFDLVLMDCHMPEMDGFEATRRIRVGARPHVLIAAMTANAMAGDRERCLTAGMDDYISKPMKISDLATLIARIVSLGSRSQKAA